MVTQSSGILDSASAVVGLAPGSNLITSLYESLVISSPVFAFYLSNSEEYSYFDVGAIDDTAMLDAGQLITHSNTDSTKWSGKIEGIRIGDDDAYKVEAATAIIDSTSSCIVMPSDYYFWLLDKLFEDYGMSFTSKNGSNVYLSSCLVSFELPMLYFLVNGYWY